MGKKWTNKFEWSKLALLYDSNNCTDMTSLAINTQASTTSNVPHVSSLIMKLGCAAGSRKVSKISSLWIAFIYLGCKLQFSKPAHYQLYVVVCYDKSTTACMNKSSIISFTDRLCANTIQSNYAQRNLYPYEKLCWFWRICYFKITTKLSTNKLGNLVISSIDVEMYGASN